MTCTNDTYYFSTNSMSRSQIRKKVNSLCLFLSTVVRVDYVYPRSNVMGYHHAINQYSNAAPKLNIFNSFRLCL